MLLGNCDDVEQPVSAALVGKELCAVGIQDCAIDAVAIPVLGAGELAELDSESVAVFVMLCLFSLK